MLQIAQVIKKKSSGLELFKMNDDERIKQFKIVFDFPEYKAVELNKAFNMYAGSYFKMVKFVKFYNNPFIDLSNAVYILSELDPNHKFVVHQYPSKDTVLVNLMVPIRIQVESIGGSRPAFIRKATGQYYLKGAIITLKDPSDRLFEVRIKYTEDSFIEEYLDYIKNPTKTNTIRDNVLSILNREPMREESHPIKLDYEPKIPKAMLNSKTVAIIDLTKMVRVYSLISELLLEYNEVSDEVLSNEISRDYNEHIFERLSTLTEINLYDNLESFDKYELTSRILGISDTMDIPGIDRETIRDYSMISYLIYLNIHDGVLRVNPQNSIVVGFTSDKKGQSLLEYYIDFMISVFKLIFHKDISDSGKIIKNIYMNFVQLVRKPLNPKVTYSISTFPPSQCGLYNKFLEQEAGPNIEKGRFKDLMNLNIKLIEEAKNRKNLTEVQYKVWDFRTKVSRSYVITVSSLHNYYSFTETPGNNGRVLGGGNPVILPGTPEKIPLKETYDLATEIRKLRAKVTRSDLETFGLFKKKMTRDEKHNPKTFNRESYYKSAVQFLKTSVVELIYLKKIGNYSSHFRNLQAIEYETNPEIASNKMRAYLFKLLSENLKPDEINAFLDSQNELYSLYEILEYDVEYKKQKKLEQYEKRNMIYYNLTPEEKLLLGIDKLHGEERMNLLDRLVAEKEALSIV